MPTTVFVLSPTLLFLLNLTADNVSNLWIFTFETATLLLSLIYVFSSTLKLPEFLTNQIWQYSNSPPWIWKAKLVDPWRQGRRYTCYYESSSIKYVMVTFFLHGNQGSEIRLQFRLRTSISLLFVGISASLWEFQQLSFERPSSVAVRYAQSEFPPTSTWK